MTAVVRNPERLDRIAEIITENPGIAYSDLSRQLNATWNAVRRYLTSMERAGYLISEDNYHQLYYHGRAEVSGLRRLP